MTEHEQVAVAFSRAKRRLKAGPKQYKLRAGATGRERLQRRVNSLLVASVRLARKGSDEDRQWADRLVETLRAFTAQEFADTTTFDVQALIVRE